MENSYYNKILNSLRRFCGKSEKCSFDVLKKLEYYNLSEQQKHKIIETLKKEKFIDEERYAKAFVNDKIKFNKWGKIKIYYGLKLKKIPEKIINKYLDNINENEYIQVLTELIEHKNSTINEEDPYKKKSALYRFATSKGFEYDVIEKIIREM